MKQLELIPPKAVLPATAVSNSSAIQAYSEDAATAAIVDQCTRAICWRPDDGSAVESGRLPTAQERTVLEQRRSRLAVIVRGCGVTDAEKRKAAAAIADMLSGFTSLRGVDTREIVAGYVMDLQALPAWAIVAACGRVKRGEVVGMSLDFAPSSPRLYQIAAGELVPLRAEEARIAETLTLQPRQHVTDEERARLGERFKALSADLRERTKDAPDDAADKRTARAIAEQQEFIRRCWEGFGGTAPTIGGIPVSRELAAHLRLDVHEAAP